MASKHGSRFNTESILSITHVTNLSRGINVHYVLRNVSEIFSLGEFHNSPNFLPAKVSLHTVIPNAMYVK